MCQRYSRRCGICQEDVRAAHHGTACHARHECVFLTRMSERLRGLLFRKPDGLVRVFVPCNSVHTVGMAHEIDIAFLDGEGVVLAAYRKVGKRRYLRCRSARITLERFADERPWFERGDHVSLESMTCKK